MYGIKMAAGAAVIAMAAGAAAAANATAGDLMSACKADIAKTCPDVAKGKGRITACLIAYDHRLSGGCRKVVRTFSEGRAYRKFVPAAMRSDKGPQLEAELRRVCSPDIGRLCPGVKSGKGRVLACLYARSGNVSKPCSSAAKTDRRRPNRPIGVLNTVLSTSVRV